MLQLGLKVIHVLPVRDSWLHREIESLPVPFTPVSSKLEAISAIESLSFDVFVSTGFPFILPISRLRETTGGAEFVNIHPSYLPDLRGADPIPGAILHRRDSGVSCHLMDDGVDTGPIIAQRKIPFSESLDAGLLYQLCFRLEPEIFEAAFQIGFSPQRVQKANEDSVVYYTFRDSDLILDLTDSDQAILSRVRAFNTGRKGVRFRAASTEFKTFAADFFESPAITRLYAGCPENTIVATFDDSILVARKASVLRLAKLEPRPASNVVGNMIAPDPHEVG